MPTCPCCQHTWTEPARVKRPAPGSAFVDRDTSTMTEADMRAYWKARSLYDDVAFYARNPHNPLQGLWQALHTTMTEAGRVLPEHKIEAQRLRWAVGEARGRMDREVWAARCAPRWEYDRKWSRWIDHDPDPPPQPEPDQSCPTCGAVQDCREDCPDRERRTWQPGDPIGPIDDADSCAVNG